MNRVSMWVITTMTLIVACVGTLDAFVSREWDLLVVFVLIISLELIVWLRLRADRTPVTLRRDVARWLEQQSQRTGEPFDDILDRAVAWYHSGLFVDRGPSQER